MPKIVFITFQHPKQGDIGMQTGIPKITFDDDMLFLLLLLLLFAKVFPNFSKKTTFFFTLGLLKLHRISIKTKTNVEHQGKCI